MRIREVDSGNSSPIKPDSNNKLTVQLMIVYGGIQLRIEMGTTGIMY